MRFPLDTSTILLAAAVGHLLAGHMQVRGPQSFVSQHFGQAGGVRALVLTTPGGTVFHPE